MYQFRHNQEGFENFILPFGGRLRSDNRLVVLAKIMPCGEFEGSYCEHFAKRSKRGAPVMSLR